MSKYEVISDLYFPAVGLNTGKYGPETTPYFDTFHAVKKNQAITQKQVKFKIKSVLIMVIHDFTIQEFNRLTSENFTARLAKANLASKSDITNFVKKTDLNKLSKKLKQY